MVLTVPGRKTGQPRATPMTPFTLDEQPVVYPDELPVGIGFLKRSGLVRDGTPDEIEALAGRIAVFRFDPISPPRCDVNSGARVDVLCRRAGARWLPRRKAVQWELLTTRRWLRAVQPRPRLLRS